MNPTLKHYDLSLIQPRFESKLTDLVIELDSLRNKLLFGTTKPFMFFQMKEIFHLLETLGSARIEGNNTTISELVESKIENSYPDTPNMNEISNLRNAMDFIDANIDKVNIDNSFIRELHKIVVDKLPLPPEGEGDKTPGKYRTYRVEIKKSNHLPPENEVQILSYMDELIKFIKETNSPKYDLIKTALVHHRFMWIHPFGNGNGRTGRLLTYAMLVKQGFNLKNRQFINPTAIFCLDREIYNEKLGIADNGTTKGLTQWCEFVLNGLKSEIQKIDKLLDYKFFRDEIVVPSLKISLDRKLITKREESILRLTIGNEEQIIANKDIKKYLLKEKSTQQISNIIKDIVERKMLMPLENAPRKYHLRFDNNYLLRGIIEVLREKNFLPFKD